jgi:polyhydroxyalkanoate synthesis regulator phasin
MIQTNRNPTLQGQTDNQLKLALAAGDLDGDERRQILDELERRRRARDRQPKAGQQAVEAALSDMSHAELLAWTPSLIDEEDRAMARELRARIKALENKLAEVQHRELKPVADVDHPHVGVE